MSDAKYFTEEGLQHLKDELEQLISVERPSISQQIADARDKGDLSENAEYDAAKEAQGLLELKISKMQAKMANARIIDESKMEKAFEGLLREAGNLNEEDPRQMASLMRRFSDKTGLSLGDKMEEALSRLESGEDPDSIEQEMGDLLDGEEGFSLEDMKKKILSGPKPPAKDDKLYEL